MLKVLAIHPFEAAGHVALHMLVDEYVSWFAVSLNLCSL